jgi:hypothetical protein
MWPIGLDCDARQALGIIPGETYREPQASSSKRRAASCKKRFDIYFIYDYIGYINRKVNMNDDIITKIALERIADALEEILRLVKLDQEKMAKRFPEPETDELSKEWKHD